MDLSIYPVSFFVSGLALIGASLFAWKHRREGWGLPLLAVLGTVAAWYHGDGLYNDYEIYRLKHGDDSLSAAWWQVFLFVLTLSLLVRPIHQQVNQRLIKRRSHLILFTMTNKIDNPSIQRQLDLFSQAILGAWIILMTIALYRMSFNFGGMFTPYLEGWKAKPWSRGRVGGGISAFLSLASYLQIMLTACFGVVAALSFNPKTRMMAIFVCFLAFPYYIFDRTRNPMIATMLPGLLAWVFLRLRGSLWKKGGILLVAFVMMSSWFKLVVDTEMGRGVTVGNALKDAKAKREKPVELADDLFHEEKESRHQGLSMFYELSQMNVLFNQGLYQPTWGGRYFAEAVNFIPRALWKNKPMVGVDYALARGFADKEGADASGGGITASIATGMIGQGVANFGRFFGPMGAALLMSIWVSVLARLDLSGDIARLVLCILGMILTFNMGRDITLFVLYPFVFGYMLLMACEWWQAKKGARHVSAPVRRHRQSPPR
jgi:hypothetical protein